MGYFRQMVNSKINFQTNCKTILGSNYLVLITISIPFHTQILRPVQKHMIVEAAISVIV